MPPSPALKPRALKPCASTRLSSTSLRYTLAVPRLPDRKPARKRDDSATGYVVARPNTSVASVQAAVLYRSTKRRPTRSLTRPQAKEDSSWAKKKEEPSRPP